MKSKIIAEIGWNHLGNIKLAEKFIKAAADNGADFCKFQTWSVNNLKSGKWDDDGRRQIYEKAQLSEKDHYKLKSFCKKYKVKFLTSVFNINDIAFLKKLNSECIKIPSHEIYNIELIKAALKNFKIVLISAGAAKWKEIINITKLRNFKKKAILMHCVSSYPLEKQNINFPKFYKLRKLSKNIGYSGHFNGIDDAVIAISLGASFVEKHFTINKNLPGRDNKFAILPNDLKVLNEFRNNVSFMNIDRGLDVQKCEIDIFKNYRGRWSK